MLTLEKGKSINKQWDDDNKLNSLMIVLMLKMKLRK